MIVVVEDLNDDFEAIKYLLDRAFVRLHSQHEVVRCKTLGEVERHLVECEQHNIPLLLIFDNLMELPGGEYQFIDLIRTLWVADPSTWRGNVPIIIYSGTRSEEFSRLYRRRHRRNSAFVNKFPEAGEHRLLRLRAALNTALQAL